MIDGLQTMSGGRWTFYFIQGTWPSAGADAFTTQLANSALPISSIQVDESITPGNENFAVSFSYDGDGTDQVRTFADDMVSVLSQTPVGLPGVFGVYPTVTWISAETGYHKSVNDPLAKIGDQLKGILWPVAIVAMIFFGLQIYKETKI